MFAELLDGQYLELISDHSLAPLQKLFQKEKQGFFKWQEVESGPEEWKTTILKTDSLHLSINEMLKDFPLAINVFERHGIPYFQLGTERLSDISKDAQGIYEEIRQSQQLLINPLRTDNWSIAFTVDYIINNHHTYVKEVIPELESLIEHLEKAHASTHPQLPMIRERFAEFKNELIEHLNDEEEFVFPSFKRLEESINGNTSTGSNGFDDSISWMEEDHILTGTTLKAMRNYCNNYIAPQGSSPGFIILFEELRKFEMDMHFHMHLENNVLFTKVMKVLRAQKAD